MGTLVRRGCGCLVLVAVLLIASCNAIVNTVVPPLSGRGPDGPTTWKTGMLLRPVYAPLELRASPGEQHAVVARIPTNGVRIATLGPAYRVDGVAWIEVRFLDSTFSGWVPRAAVALGE